MRTAREKEKKHLQKKSWPRARRAECFFFFRLNARVYGAGGSFCTFGRSFEGENNGLERLRKESLACGDE